MDASVTINLVMIAFRTVIISVKVICIIFMKQCVAARAAGIVILIAMVTESSVLVTIAIACPDSFTASVTGGRVMFKTVCADYLTIDFFVM